MRSDLLPIDQFLMCVNKTQYGDSHPTPISTMVKREQYSISSPDNSRTSYDDNETIAFGPIKVKPRKKPAPTLATGRRSKYEILNADEEQKRNVRRARNRAAAERVRVSRLNIEQQLLDQIDALETQQEKLSNDVQKLQHQKLHLETRLYTHEQMCSNNYGNNSTISSQVDLINYFPADYIQENNTTINDKLPDIDFDFFFNSLTTEQLQQTFPEALQTMDLNDLLMDLH